MINNANLAKILDISSIEKPFTKHSPLSLVSTPTRIFIVVLFPAPLRPKKAKSPSSTENEISSTAFVSPKYFFKFFISILSEVELACKSETDGHTYYGMSAKST